jgi:S-adenosylmethionine hydrolase
MGVPPPSRTFHGRDLFAPSAAVLGLGDDLDALGSAIDAASLVRCPLPVPERASGGWRATVLHVDRFGNLVTNLAAADTVPAAVVSWGADRTARRVGTFAEGGPGEVVVLEGSSGLLELVVNDGSAAEATGLARGDTIEVIGD